MNKSDILMFARLSIAVLVMLVSAPRAIAGAGDTVSLAGSWRFEIASADASNYTRELPGTINLPGTIDDAGLGPKGYAGSLNGPQRRFFYHGPAWYQRDIEIPADWEGKRITLFLERCRWVTTVYLGDQKIGSQDSLISPHVYDLGTTLKPGKHRLTICVDNTVKLNLPGGQGMDGGTWGNMNGIVGRIELAATPPVWIDDVQVYPDAAQMTALVKVRIGNATGKAGRGTLLVNNKSVEASWDASGGRTEIEMDLEGVKLWDEFSPNLTELMVKLGDSTRSVRFGVRDFSSKGTQFTLNGRPIFLRGTLECSVWPLTGYPPTDVSAWHRIYRIMKSYGLNHIRFHSWCPPEAAFIAADEAGIIIQTEGVQGNGHVGVDPAVDAFHEAELKRIVDTYGNHPSFCLMALGNEYHGPDALLTEWVDMLQERDPRRLVSSPSNGQTTANRQFNVPHVGRGIKGPGTERDLRQYIANDVRPSIIHEIGQWMFWPDSKEIEKWTGVMALRNYEIIRDDLAKKNLLHLEPQYVQASGKFATLLYKEEIEVILRTPGYGGFQLLDLKDYPMQGTAVVGVLDAFWDSKGFITPEGFRRFCGPTVPLLRMPKRAYTADETFAATADLSHFGPTDLANVKPVWKVKDDQGHEIASGTLPVQSIETGKLTSLGDVNASLAKAVAPCKLTVSIALEGTKISNDWEIWVYPSEVATEPPNDVVVCENWDDAKAALAQGKDVVYFALTAGAKRSMPGGFLPVFWSPVAFPNQKPNTMGLLLDPKHPLFAQFPTEMHSNWQWYNLTQKSRAFILDDSPAIYQPIVQNIDNFARNHKLGIIFEGRVGRGNLLVCGFDLLNQSEDPVARQLLAGIYTYVGSQSFKPTQTFSDETLDELFGRASYPVMDRLGAKINWVSSEGPGNNVDYVLDGNPQTIWHTPWLDAPDFPHAFVIEFPKPVRMSGVTCLPRQGSNPHGWIKDYAVYASADGKDWGEPVAKGSFPYDENLQTIPFATPIETSFLKFVALDSFNPGQPFAALAEISILEETPSP